MGMDAIRVSEIDKLSDDFAKLYLSEEFADVHFLVENEKIPAHKIILAVRSAYFRALLFGSFSDSSRKEIQLPLSVDSLKLILRFIYLGKVSIPVNNAFEILKSSNEFGFVEIENAISEYLLQNLSVENIMDAYNAATIYSLPLLEEKSLELIYENFQEFLTHPSFSSVNEYGLKKVLSSKRPYLASDKVKSKTLKLWAAENHIQDSKFIDEYLMENCDNEEFTGFFINLGEEQSINYLELTIPNNEQSFIIENSSNKVNWIRKSIENIDSTELVYKIHFPIEKIKYFKIYTKDGTELFLKKFKSSLLPEIEGLLQTVLQPTRNVALLEMGATSNNDILINGDFTNFTGHVGFAHQPITPNSFLSIKLRQPLVIDSLRLRLWDIQPWRHYRYFIEYSLNNVDWNILIDNRRMNSRSWQNFKFKPTLIWYIKITGTYSAPDPGSFHVVHFECPSQDTNNFMNIEEIDENVRSNIEDLVNLNFFELHEIDDFNSESDFSDD